MLWSDAWILLATLYAAREQSAPLADVIGAADGIQHAIVTFEEMEGALGRLTADGYLVYSDGTLTPSDTTLDFYRAITKPRRRILDEEKDLEKFIGATPWSRESHPKLANAGVSFPELSRGQFDAAVKLYFGRH